MLLCTAPRHPYKRKGNKKTYMLGPPALPPFSLLPPIKIRGPTPVSNMGRGTVCTLPVFRPHNASPFDHRPTNLKRVSWLGPRRAALHVLPVPQPAAGARPAPGLPGDRRVLAKAPGWAGARRGRLDFQLGSLHVGGGRQSCADPAPEDPSRVRLARLCAPPSPLAVRARPELLPPHLAFCAGDPREASPASGSHELTIMGS